MAFTTVYEESNKTVYKARKCSSAYFFSIICILIKIILPLILISNNLWIKVDTFNEQPRIEFKHKFILLLEKMRPNSENIFYSTFTHLNQAFEGPMIRIPAIKSYEEDKDRDGRNENLHLSMSVPTKIDEEIVGMKLFLFFNYQTDILRLQFESLILIDCYSHYSSSQLDFYGEIKLNQKESLPSKGYRENSIYNRELNDNLNDFGVLDGMEMKDFNLMNVAKRYFERNFTTTLNNKYCSWTIGRDPRENFKINLNINYNQRETIRFQPGFWYLIKWGWIQFFAVFIVINYMVDCLMKVVYTNQLLCTIIDTYPKQFVNDDEYK